eukprot:m51a1_g4163 hypothetical protein (368) ;mRNA; r:285353-286652
MHPSWPEHVRLAWHDTLSVLFVVYKHGVTDDVGAGAGIRCYLCAGKTDNGTWGTYNTATEVVVPSAYERDADDGLSDVHVVRLAGTRLSVGNWELCGFCSDGNYTDYQNPNMRWATTVGRNLRLTVACRSNSSDHRTPCDAGALCYNCQCLAGSIPSANDTATANGTACTRCGNGAVDADESCDWSVTDKSYGCLRNCSCGPGLSSDGYSCQDRRDHRGAPVVASVVGTLGAVAIVFLVAAVVIGFYLTRKGRRRPAELSALEELRGPGLTGASAQTVHDVVPLYSIGLDSREQAGAPCQLEGTLNVPLSKELSISQSPLSHGVFTGAGDTVQMTTSVLSVVPVYSVTDLNDNQDGSSDGPPIYSTV